MADQDAASKSRVPPYVAYRTFTNFLESLKNVGIPSHIDSSTMPSLSGSTRHWLNAALLSMGLIHSDRTHGVEIENLAKAEGGERQRLLRELFLKTYRPLFESGLKLETTTPAQLEKGLGDMGATGATLTKCRAFFLALANDSGVELSAYLKRASRKSGNSKRKRTPKPREQSTAPQAPSVEFQKVRSISEMLLEMLRYEDIHEDEKSAVWTLLQLEIRRSAQ